MYNPAWWDEWRSRNYRKQARLMRKSSGRGLIHKFVNLFNA
jgi:hypothetical protein